MTHHTPRHTRRRLRTVVICTVVGLAFALTPLGLAGSAEGATLRVRLGVVSVSTMYAGSDYAGEAAQVSGVGASSIRIPAKWNLIQPGAAAAYNWSQLDQAVRAARTEGLDVLLNLKGPAPVWAQKPGADPLANGNAPLDPQDFRTFARAVALRYSPYVFAWEIWNEPNLSHYLIPPTADEYLPLLRAAYSGIRSSGATQPIITGGTSSSRGDTRDISFIERLYLLGGRPYIDGIGVHPYTFPYPLLNDPRFGDGGGAAVLRWIRSAMLAAGEGNKKVWITEFGQPTGTSSMSVSEAKQASIVTDALSLANSADWVAAIFIFNSHDLVAGPSILDGNMGLYRHDGTPKPVVAAITSLTGG